MKKIGVEQTLFLARRMRDEIVYNIIKLEGNTLSFAETSSVIKGISVGGKPMIELRQVENTRDGWDAIISQVRDDEFELTKENFVHINLLLARGENIEPGDFRTRQVLIAGTAYMPPLPMLLSTQFREMIAAFEKSTEPHKAYDIFLDSARNQFLADGNKRTGLLMMNGYLMQSGFAPISIAPEAEVQYKDELIIFYETGDKAPMYEFLRAQQSRLEKPF